MQSLLIGDEPNAKLKFLLGSSADPDGARHYLGRISQEEPEAFARLCASDAALQILIAVFSHSRFLSEEILQHPDWVDALVASPDLFRVLSSEEYAQKLEAFLGADSKQAPSALSLAVFRRQQLLRILVRDVLEYAELSEVTEEISSLADAILDVTYRRSRPDMMVRFGTPRFEEKECGFSVLALGK